MELNVSIYTDGELKGCKKITTPCVIGRSKEAGLSIGHRAVSRKHCELYETADKLFLRDCGSLNGTLFKGEYIENPVALSYNDEFIIGDLVFRVTSPAKSLTEEQRKMTERPTAAFALNVNSEDESAPMMQTVMELPKKSFDTLAEENQNGGKEKKSPLKVSPSKVRIVT